MLAVGRDADKLAAAPAPAEGYAAYTAEYIKEPGSPKLPFWQILLDDLRSPAAQEQNP